MSTPEIRGSGQESRVGEPPGGEPGTGPGQDSSAAPPSGAWRWFVPSVGYALVLGLLGVTTKVALDDMRWSELFVWVAVAYAVVAFALVVGGVRPRLSQGAGFAALSGVFASSALLFLFVALEHGDAGQVVPVTAAYPIVTAAVAAAVLAERVTARRLVGTLLVVVGVVIIGLE